MMLARILSLAAALLAFCMAPAAAQIIENTEVSESRDYVERDARVSFDRKTAGYARVDLDDLDPGDHGRAAALVALGSSGSVEGRPILIAETSTGGRTSERAAAALGLGELGSSMSEGLDVLIRLTRDSERMVAYAAMVALVRSGLPDGRSAVAEISAQGGVHAEEARAILAHHIDPRGTEASKGYREFYALHWNAARTYGLIDGKVWGATLMSQLASDPVFLEALVLHLTRDLELDGAKDHLLEILLEGEGAQRVITAAEMMPFEVESMVDSGVWRPADWKEWKWLVLTILHNELHAFFPRTLALSIPFPVTQPIAAGLLQRGDARFEDLLIKGFTDEDPRNRAYAAYSVGVSETAAYLPRLIELCDDPVDWTQANAIGALIRMGNRTGVERAVGTLTAPPTARPGRLASYLYEVLYRAAPDPEVMLFVEEMSTRLEGADRASIDGIMILHGARVDTELLRRELPLMNPTTPEAIRCARALGSTPNEKDLKLLQRMFPREKAIDMNLELASALSRSGDRSAEPLLKAAVWTLPWNLSVLAGGVVQRTYGERRLISWLVAPPLGATDEDIRRVGYSVGEWGGMPAVAELRKQLGTTSGAELPALQGAVLGALASRTR